MSNHTHQENHPEVRLDRLAPVAGLVALVGVLLMAVGLFTNAPAALGSYMFAFIFWLTVTLGFFGFSLLHHTVRGSWSVSILRLLEAGGGPAMILTFVVLFLPIAFGMHTLYEWTHHEVVQADAILSRKTWYLNETGFLIRAAIYFLVWLFLANLMRRSTLKQDETKEFKLESKRSTWGAAGFVAFFLTATFAFIDWAMTMEPHWFSSMYPVWHLVGSGLAGLSLAVMIVCLNADKEPFRQVVSPNLTKDLGNMLFVLTMLWGYTSVSQYLIIWNGNIPEFTQYFIRRQGNWWNGIGMALIFGQFIIPFMALLSPRTKAKPMRLAKIAGWMFVFHIVDVYQTIIPAVPATARPHDFRFNYSPMPLWTDLAAFLTIGAIWVLVFALQTRKAPLLPTYDTRLQEALSHAH